MAGEHERYELLLPWYAAGRLEGREAEELSEHLKGCARCAQEVRALLRVRNALGELESELPGPSAGTLDRLLARVLRHEQQLSRARQRVPWLVAVLCAAVAAVAVAVPRPAAQFATLGAAREHRGPTLQVVFDPNATEAQIRSLLLSVGGVIEEGPRPSGLYRVRLGAGADPQRAVVRLRADRRVWFVEREP